MQTAQLYRALLLKKNNHEDEFAILAGVCRNVDACYLAFQFIICVIRLIIFTDALWGTLSSENYPDESMQFFSGENGQGATSD